MATTVCKGFTGKYVVAVKVKAIDSAKNNGPTEPKTKFRMCQTNCSVDVCGILPCNPWSHNEVNGALNYFFFL